MTHTDELRHLTQIDMLHSIRASVRQIQREAGHGHCPSALGVERRLSALLGRAILTRSALDIAIVLGSAAELMMFPEEAILEQCTATVDAAGQRALRSVVWTVRHRCRKAGRHSHRFSVSETFQ